MPPHALVISHPSPTLAMSFASPAATAVGPSPPPSSFSSSAALMTAAAASKGHRKTASSGPMNGLAGTNGRATAPIVPAHLHQPSPSPPPSSATAPTAISVAAAAASAVSFSSTIPLPPSRPAVIRTSSVPATHSPPTPQSAGLASTSATASYTQPSSPLSQPRAHPPLSPIPPTHTLASAPAHSPPVPAPSSSRFYPAHHRPPSTAELPPTHPPAPALPSTSDPSVLPVVERRNSRANPNPFPFPFSPSNPPMHLPLSSTPTSSSPPLIMTPPSASAIPSTFTPSSPTKHPREFPLPPTASSSFSSSSQQSQSPPSTPQLRTFLTEGATHRLSIGGGEAKAGGGGGATPPSSAALPPLSLTHPPTNGWPSTTSGVLIGGGRASAPSSPVKGADGGGGGSRPTSPHSSESKPSSPVTATHVSLHVRRAREESTSPARPLAHSHHHKEPPHTAAVHSSSSTLQPGAAATSSKRAASAGKWPSPRRDGVREKGGGAGGGAVHDGEKAPRSTLSSPAPPSSLSGSPSLVTPSLFSLLFHPSLLLSQVRQLRKHMMKPEDAPHPSLQSGLASCFTSPALSSFTTPSPTPSPRTTPWTRALLSLSLFLLLSLSLWWWLSSSLPLSLLLSHYFPSSVSPSSIYFHSPPSAAVFTDAASSSSSTFTIVSILDLPSSPSFLFPSSLSSSPIHLLRWHALMSWVLAVGPIHVMVYVDNERTCAWLSERPELRGLKCFLIPSIHPTYKRPLLPALFEHAHSHTGDRLIAFMARPAFLHPSVADIVGNVSHSLDRFMLVTRRTNVVLPADTLSPYTASLFTPSTSPFVVPSSSSYLPSYQQLMSPYISTLTRVFEYADHYGKLHSEYGIDLFIYPKAIFSLLQFPPYLAGVYRWDNWWLSEMILHDDVTVVDLSSTTLPLLTHDGDRTVDHPTEDGAHYNDRITKLRSGNQYKLGHANNADFRLEGRCPHCTLLKNPLQSIAVLLAKRINRSSYLAVLTFDGSMDDTVQMELLHNSMCWMQRIGFTHFITLVQDTRVAAHLTRLGIPVIHRDSSEDPSNPLTANGLPTSPDASDFAIFHVEVLRQVLKAGYHFFTGPATALLLDDPLVYLHRQLDVQLSINHTADQLTAASFWSARATTYGRDFVMKLKECVDKAKQMPKTLQTERACLADVWKLMKKNKAVKRGALDDLRFASADAALIRQLPQQQGLSLVAVDLSDQMQKRLTRGNGTRGEEKDEGKALLQLLDSWHLHLHLQPMQGDHRCLQPLYPALPPSNDGVSNPFSFSLKIKIVASFRPRSLLSLLRSLQAAVYDDDQVELEVTIDGLPAVNPTEKEKAKHAEVKKIVADFVWTQGPLVVTEERESKKGPGETGDWKGKGAFGTFLSAWTPSSSNPHQVLLLLPEYVQLSQAYYQYIKRTVSHYYLDREHYDPAMYGISLQSNMPVLATDYDVAEELPSEALLYRYQHFGSLGTVVFPQHWTAFQRWVQSKGYNTEHGMLLSLSLTDAFSNSTSTSAFSATNISNPCVPSLPSNMYWLAWNDKYNRATPTNTTLSFAIDHLYPLFFARFLHERGWYGLFPHFPDHQQLLLQSEEEKVRTVFAFSHEHDTRDKQNPDHRPRALSTLPFYSHSLPALASLALFDTAGHDVNPRLDPDDSRQDDADDRSDSRRAVGADDAADAEDVQLTLSRRGNRERSKVLAARPYQWSRSPQCSIVLRDKRREEARLQGLGLGQVVPTLPVLSNGLAAGVHAGPGRKEAGKEGAAGGEAGEKHAGGAAGAGVHPAKKVVEEDQGEEEPVDHTELLKKWKEGGRAE